VRQHGCRAQRFSIAADEDLVTLISDLQNRITEIDSEVAALGVQFRNTTTEFLRIRNLLQSKRETITPGEVQKRKGKGRRTQH
jgi:hypothetical protein